MAENHVAQALGLLRAAINSYETNDKDEAEKHWAECKEALDLAGIPIEVKVIFVHIYSDAYERYEERNPTGQTLEVA